MGTISRVTTWSTGDTLSASDLNGEFDNILSTANGSLNADNLGVTAGQASASKAIVLDSNKDFANATGSNQIRNLTLSGSLKIGTTFLPDASGGADLGSTTLEWGDVYVADDKYLYMGSDQNIKIGYDETTTDSLAISAIEGAGLAITLRADEGDDAGDEWKLNVADGGTITLGNDIASAGTFVTHLTLTPHATVSSSTLALAGALTVAGTAGVTGVATVGGLTIGSAVINEADLEQIDDLTAGTVTASKAVVVDSNKDIGSFRNVTLTGELDAATGDFSGAVDIAGDLTLSAGADGALRFSAASSVKMLDNSAASLVFEEADDAYMTFVTTNSSEAVKFDKALDINAAMQIDSTITVGVDDQGYDVKFFGDTASAYLLWDTSADKLLTAGGATIDIVKDKLLIGGTAVTTTAAELNTLDAVTAGTVAASKAVVVDSNKDIGTFRNITIDGTFSDGNYTFDTSGNVSGLGTIGSGAITATDTTAPLILKYDAGEYVTHAVSSAGVYSIATTDASSDSGAITLDTVDSITLDSDTASEGIVYADGGTNLLRVSNSSSDVIFKPLVDAKDIVFQQYDGNEVCRIADNRRLYFYDEGGEYISSSGSALTLASGSAAWELPAADGSDGQVLKTDGSGNLDWVSQTSGATLSGSTDNTVVTVTGSNAMQGEANLTFDGSTLAVTGTLSAGALTATGNISFDGGSFVFNETGADKDFRIEGDSEANLFFADASTDRIGIGTNSPSTLLHLKSSGAGDPKIKIENTAADQHEGMLHFYKTGSSPADADAVGSVGFYADNSADEETLFGDMKAYTDDVTDGTEDGSIKFRTTTAGTLTDTMALVSGKVGIGTNSPSYALSVESAASVVDAARFSLSLYDTTSMAAGVGAGIAFWGRHTSGSFSYMGAIQGAKSNGTDSNLDGDLVFSTRQHSGGTMTERVRMTPTGVGIGTTSPDGQLHIHNGSAGTITAQADYDEITVENSGNVGIQMLCPQNYYGGISFGDGNSGDTDNGGILYLQSGTASSRHMHFRVDDAERMRITNTGEVKLFNASGTHTVHLDPAGDSFFKGGALSMNCDIGSRTADLTIKQTKLDVAQFNDPDVAHGMTSLTNTDTFGALANLHGTEGGILMNGYAEGTKAIGFGAWATTSDATKSTSAVGAIYWDCGEKNGTDVHAFDSNDNLMVITNRTTARFIFDADGDGHADSAWTTFDSHDDIAMLHDIEATMVPDTFGKAMKYDAPYLEKIGIIGAGSLREENGKTRGMINYTRLQMLHHGAIRQVHQQLQDVKDFYEDKLAALEARLLRLEA